MQRVGEPHGLVAGLAADMDMLAEDGELLGQITIALGQFVEALAGADSALRPLVEGMGAAAADRDVVVAAMGHQNVTQHAQVGLDAGDVLPRLGTHLDHALGNLELHVAVLAAIAQPGEQVAGGAGQIEVPVGDELEFQLHPEGQRRTV